MGYADKDIFAGKDVNGNPLVAGFHFQADVEQGTDLTEAILSLWPLRLYPAGTPFWDRFGGGIVILEEHIADLHSGLPWVKRQGRIQIEGGSRAWTRWEPPNEHIYTIDPGEADGTIVSPIAAEQYGNWGGLVFRFVDMDNYFYVRGRGSDDRLQVYKVVDGSASALFNQDVSGVSKFHNLHTFKVVLDGSSIKVYIDDDLKADLTDTDLQTATAHGLYAYVHSDNIDTRWYEFDFIPSGTPSVDLEVACHDVDDAPDFSSSLPGDRVLTTAKTSLGDISDWILGQWNETVDIKAPLQEILDRVGWAADQHVAVIIQPTDSCGNGEILRIAAYEHDSDYAAVLKQLW